MFYLYQTNKKRIMVPRDCAATYHDDLFHFLHQPIHLLGWQRPYRFGYFLGRIGRVHTVAVNRLRLRHCRRIVDAARWHNARLRCRLLHVLFDLFCIKFIFSLNKTKKPLEHRHDREWRDQRADYDRATRAHSNCALLIVPFPCLDIRKIHILFLILILTGT